MKQMRLVLILLGALAVGRPMPAAAQPAPLPPPVADDASIAAVVNGQVITDEDVQARARLLAISTGLRLTPDALARLTPQITTQLINQTLQLQEINRRGVVVQESDITGAVGHIEQGNNLPAGALREHLEAAGVPFGTLVAQLRTELGWQQVLHQVLGPELQPTAGDIRAEKAALTAEIGTTQYHLGEIFVPVTNPSDEATARNFANAVIAQLRQGAPFPIVAAEFSQADSALQGGDLGFLPLNQLDPATAAVVTSMPTGAISNPIRVPGGYDIVQLQEVHRIGEATTTTLAVREVFATFAEPVSGVSLAPDQIATVEKLVRASHAVHDCDDMTQLNADFGNVRPVDPGPVNLANVTPPQFQSLLATLPINQISQPLIAQDGASVVMVCNRQSAATGLPSDDAIREVIIDRRVQLESQQLLDDLRHRSIITQD